MRYAVDPDELRLLARGIHDIHDTLAGLGVGEPYGAAGGPGGAALGSPAVAGALREVAGNRSKSRRQLLVSLAHLALATEAAAATYRQADGGPGR